MYFYLLTVESSSQSGPHLQILPPVPVSDLIERAKGLLMPMAGDELELRLPDGHVQHALVGGFGVEIWRHEDGHFSTTSDPSNPALTLTLAGDLSSEDAPAGTEIWLSEAKYQTSTEASEDP
ncbi:MAG TPA: hypothetical protein VKR06_18860 [Ktedonosporobacter sp.]|nr:hypothetical protein [Ktedonosporobacter sp.]